MDLDSGQLITRTIVHKIPVTNVVIKAVKSMAYQQGFKSLKFKNRNRVLYHDTNWIAGVDYDDIKNDNEQYYKDNEDDKTKQQFKQYEQINPEEIDCIIRKARLYINPQVHEEDDSAN
jgi:hypothetical protein